ncbi:acetyl-CoA synthetase-like protein [Decorospora gaudefroyi]|uniref:Acetyl-CoA synthetase-like protein n=1 Tax=Decorospora gaudefroyi TaxID=184978 RepID=A0A6A5K897_9PLEO|nr:acetyl-CoA synthetase-like protein [Decorospora gaudefroyi]
MSPRPPVWPQGTKQLLPHILFTIAKDYPSLTYAIFPAKEGKGLRNVSYREVANAVHEVAWWIEENIGAGTKIGGQTFVYMGPNDIRYAVLCLGSIVAGHKMLFPSPRYGAPALIKLIDSVDAKVMLTPEIALPITSEILQEKPQMQSLQIPTVDQLLGAEGVQAYPFTKTFEQHGHEQFVCLHTSGTTGFPKKIPLTHEWIHHAAVSLYLPPPTGYEKTEEMLYGTRTSAGTRSLFLFPPFHSSGLFGMILFPLLSGMTPVYPHPWTTPAEGIEAVLATLCDLAIQQQQSDNEPTKQAKHVVDSVTLPPPCIEHLAKHPSLLTTLAKQVPAVAWGGGSITPSAGATVASTMRNILNGFASTEMGIWPCIRPTHADVSVDGLWEYLCPHPALNMRFDPVPTADSGALVCEAVIQRNDGTQWDGYVQPIFALHTRETEIRTGDLFVRHPAQQDMWRHYGRTDDMLVFLSNEKFYPGVAEIRISALPRVAEVMLVGTRRPKAALLLRLEGGDAGAGLDDDLWTGIEGVNVGLPVYARVERGMVVIVDTPFLKTAKGSVQKKAMLERYEKELDALYG